MCVRIGQVADNPKLHVQKAFAPLVGRVDVLQHHMGRLRTLTCRTARASEESSECELDENQIWQETRSALVALKATYLGKRT